MADNLNKRPSKGILKTSSSFDRQETPSTSKKPKGTQWDEMNIIATLHPADKDYGHMKIDEPKTPYSYEGADKKLDADLLSERLKAGAKELPRIMQSESDSDEEVETEEQKEQRKIFEKKRKEHYNEFLAMKLARKLLEEEEEDEENDDKKLNKENSDTNDKGLTES